LHRNTDLAQQSKPKEEEEEEEVATPNPWLPCYMRKLRTSSLYSVVSGCFAHNPFILAPLQQQRQQPNATGETLTSSNK
jgi:hypothetical protein